VGFVTGEKLLAASYWLQAFFAQQLPLEACWPAMMYL
jgi:hypothetical protein